MSKTLLSFLVRRALTQPFSGQWFNVCALNDLAKANDYLLVRDAEYAVLRAFHCVHFTEMPTDVQVELLHQVARTVARILGVAFTEIAPDVEVIAYQLPQLTA